MAVTNITRNLRDGALVLKDGAGSPVSITVEIDEGNLFWIARKALIEVKDRGALSHRRRGDVLSTLVGFTAKWTNLVRESGDARQVYESLTFLASAGLTSTSGAGQPNTLTWQFTCTDPTAAASEVITFTLVALESLRAFEGDQYNALEVVGVSYTDGPSIARP